MQVLTLLLDPWFVALGIPTIFLASSALAKKLIRRSGRFARSDWFLGIELTLGSMAASLIHIFDLLKKAPACGDWPQDLAEQIGAAAGFVVICFFVFLWVLSTHQSWEQADTAQKNWQLFFLGGLCNVIGFSCMFALIFAVKGV